MEEKEDESRSTVMFGATSDLTERRLAFMWYQLYNGQTIHDTVPVAGGARPVRTQASLLNGYTFKNVPQTMRRRWWGYGCSLRLGERQGKKGDCVR